MPRSYRVTIACVILLIIFTSLGCEAVLSPGPYSPASSTATPTYAPATPTFTPTRDLTASPSPSPTATPVISPTVNTTPTRCRGFMWAYGTVSPKLVSQVQDAMLTAGVEGSVRIGTFGETDTCGNNYGAQKVNYAFIVQVGEFDTRKDLARKRAIVQEIARRFLDKAPAHELGNVGVTFKSGELGCMWRLPEEEVWELVSVSGPNGAGCRLPTNNQKQTRPFATVLALLSIDLGCESFTLTADMLSVSLDCERSEGANRYMVGVTFDRDRASEGTCFHGWPAREQNLSGAEPVTVVVDGKTVYEQVRSFEWTTNNFMTFIYERIQGGQEATFPADTREKVYLRTLKQGLIAGDGRRCP
jgi:hypothetical protein